MGNLIGLHMEKAARGGQVGMILGFAALDALVDAALETEPAKRKEAQKTFEEGLRAATADSTVAAVVISAAVAVVASEQKKLNEAAQACKAMERSTLIDLIVRTVGPEHAEEIADKVTAFASDNS